MNGKECSYEKNKIQTKQTKQKQKQKLEKPNDCVKSQACGESGDDVSNK